MAIDLGTGSLKAGVIDENLTVLSRKSAPVATARPKAGVAEQSPRDWISALAKAAPAAVEAAGGPVDAISFAGHMSAPILVDAECRPLATVRTLADTQCTPYLSNDPSIATLSGNFDGTHFARAKILHAASEVELEKLATVLSPKDFLRVEMGGGFVTDPGDMANFLLLDLDTGAYSAELVSGAGLIDGALPEVQRADAFDGVLNGDWARRLDLLAGVPLVTGTGDMGAAAIGVGLGASCDAAITIGTAATILASLSERQPKLVGKLTHHLDGVGGKFALASHFNGGAVLDWLHRLSGTERPRDDWLRETSAEAQSRQSSGGERALPLVLPYLLGSGSPVFDRDETAKVLGLNAGHDMPDLLAGFQEGVAFDLANSIDVLSDASMATDRICLGGGGARLAGWPSTISDTLDRPLLRAGSDDPTLVGAAVLGFRALGQEVRGAEPQLGWSPDPRRVAHLRDRRAQAQALRKISLPPRARLLEER
ncbi:xylulokinase [Maritimibacter harenae]|uniref:xylulokinase n=1 Tax=Maritimibacter harenae TaxID=2606218 RepID=UPI001371C315|nr:FGGY-family carbohydrate kinase [Maritimibacter harenae]